MLTKNELVYRGLTYPWGRDVTLSPGTPEEIAEGVYWARIPMPGSLDHINVWLLEDGEGWTVVDTGLDLPEAREAWELLFAGVMGGKPVLRVICTHMHPDHVGLAGWITRRFDCDLWMARAEYMLCRMMAADTGRPAPEEGIDFYRALGYTEEQLDNYKEKFGGFGQWISKLPENYQRMEDWETITIGGRYWQVIVGSGHSPEHVCLYCPALKLLISGDQVLPKITPNVSVFPTEPQGDPLKSWLRSNARIREVLPDDMMVLPAHETPFYGLHIRLTQILESHKRDLVKLYDWLAEPRRVVDCFPALFKREITGGLLGMASGETLAHLNCLLFRRQIERKRDDNGVDWYQQKPDATAVD